MVEFEDIIDKLIQVKLIMMLIGETGQDIRELEDMIQEYGNTIIAKTDSIKNFINQKLGGADVIIRTIYGVRTVYGFGIEDLVKHQDYNAIAYYAGVEDLVMKTLIYPAGYMFSIEEVNQ